MANLTVAERGLFTSAQLEQVAKMPKSRLALPSDYAISRRQYRKLVLGKWAGRTPKELRAILCMDGVDWGQVPTIRWSSECDLSADEKTAVEYLLKPGDRVMQVIVDVLNGKRSVEQRLAVLEGA